MEPIKRTINGRRYDPTSSTLIFEYHTDDVQGIPNSWTTEALYRKRNGEYFLHCSGGSASRYSAFDIALGNIEGQKLIPMTNGAAEVWAKECMPSSDFTSHFGKPLTDNTKKTVSFSLSTATIEHLRRRAADNRYSISDMLEQIIMQDSAEQNEATDAQSQTEQLKTNILTHALVTYIHCKNTDLSDRSLWNYAKGHLDEIKNIIKELGWEQEFKKLIASADQNPDHGHV